MNGLQPLTDAERIAFDVGIDRGRVIDLKNKLAITIRKAELTEEGCLINPDGTDPLNVRGLMANLTDLITAWAYQADTLLADRLQTQPD